MKSSWNAVLDLESFPLESPQHHMVDPLILSHRELRAALQLAERERKKP